MKKILTTVLSAGLVLSMVACSPKSVDTNKETYNGITKITTTTTQNGKTTEEVTYTDEDGNTLDETEGKEAFEAAKKAIEAADEEVTDVVLHFDNETGQGIKAIYFALQDGDWSDSLLSDKLESSEQLNVTSEFSYVPDEDVFKIKVDFDDDTSATFENQSLSDLTDPQDVTFTFTEDGDNVSVTIS